MKDLRLLVTENSSGLIKKTKKIFEYYNCKYVFSTDFDTVENDYKSDLPDIFIWLLRNPDELVFNRIKKIQSLNNSSHIFILYNKADLSAFERLNSVNGFALNWPVSKKLLSVNIQLISNQSESGITKTGNSDHEKQLVDAKILAEESNQAKSEFLANMSHEIRTPMNTVIGMLSLVEETSLTNEQKEYIELVQSASNHLLSIINDILDLSKIEAGKVQFVDKEFDLRHSVKEVVESFKANADKKGLNLNFDINETIPSKVSGDSSHLKRILYNIIGNAIKFTHQGSCTITIKPELTGAKFQIKNGKFIIIFTIEDTGIGIAEEKLPNIFDSFSQAHSITKRHYEGTGLGLAITKQLVEKMGGKIWVESKEHRGSSFSFSIQFKEASVQIDNNAEQGKLHLNFPVSDCESLNILVAEDNELNQKLITRLLKSRGHKSIVSENGLEAIEALQKEKFDLILMDIQMPEMDGIQATEHIRADKSGDYNPKIPIVAVTAYAFNEDRERCFRAGMDDFIPKPINNAKLNSVLDDVIRKKKKST